MSVRVECRCGEVYELRDEYAGQLVACPRCGTESLAGGPVAPQADPAFDRDKFLLRQKHLAISEKYYVWDESGEVILYLERPRHLARNLAALTVGVVVWLVLGGIFVTIADLSNDAIGQTLFAILALFGAPVIGLAVGIKLSKKRHLTFFRDDTKREPLLTIRQDHKFWVLNATYTVEDRDGTVLALFHKNYLYNLFRKRWNCRDPEGTMMCVAREDSVILALLRRLLGPFFGLLRAHFLIYRGESDEVVGEFNRKLTLLDRYVLDMGRDRHRTLDRRIALALGVMLDTGERR